MADMGRLGDPEKGWMVPRLLNFIPSVGSCQEVAKNLAEELDRETRYWGRFTLSSL